MKPLAIDLFCGLGGWTEGLLAEGYHVIGFDIERHHYGDAKYPAQLVLQDVLTLHGSQFKDAALIVASPPCQEYSYMAMPWSRAQAIAAEYRSGVRDVAKLTAPDTYMQKIAVGPEAALIDVGGGASTLLADLLAAGPRSITVLGNAAPAAPQPGGCSAANMRSPRGCSPSLPCW